MPIKVFYNSACPVCRAGIEKQRTGMAGCDVDIRWTDVHRDAAEIRALGYELEAVRERLHVLDEDGRMHIGADAFAALFRRTPARRRLAAIMQLPAVRQALAAGYNRFAAALYWWNRRRGRW
jgi:predicted DCC family thiol-disulfide oxidoreductase YuxK